jgi:cytochrome b6-f complex iron-sulfur subunit
MPEADLYSDVHLNDEPAPRRAFVKLSLGVIGAGYAAGIGYPIYAYLSTPAERAAEASEVAQTTLEGAAKLPPGSAMIFKFGVVPALLIHHSDGRWVALDAVCTHLGCTVQYEADKDRIYCACHGGVYDAYTGANVSGPPPKPLAAYKVEVQDGSILVAKA